MPTALFISPHLDDAAFSCGGALAALAGGGWRTVLATVFTRSVLNPTGFALSCQTDKGVLPETDYMAVRRAEDREAAKRLGAGEVAWLDLPEAPHRGYGSAPALFSGVRSGDELWREIADRLEELLEEHAPELVFAPQALGSHVDHLQVVRAVRAARLAARTLWYRDAPYAIRNPSGRASTLLPGGLAEIHLDITQTLEAKLRACAAYATQLNFQFGGENLMRSTLTGFAAAEAYRLRSRARAVEAFLSPGSLPWSWRNGVTVREYGG